MRLDWLDRPYRELELTAGAREGVLLASLMRADQLTVAELVARAGGRRGKLGTPLTLRTVYRRLAQARDEISRPARSCEGCGRPLPAGQRRGARCHRQRDRGGCRQQAYRNRRLVLQLHRAGYGLPEIAAELRRRRAGKGVIDERVIEHWIERSRRTTRDSTYRS